MERRRGGRWVPAAVAAAVAAAMLWLAGDPFRGADAPEAGAEIAPPPRAVLLRAPVGVWESFPRHFAWEPVSGADRYELTVERAGGEVLLRRSGRAHDLEVAFGEGALPGPGEYEWTVRAFAGRSLLARAHGTFRVAGRP